MQTSISAWLNKPAAVKQPPLPNNVLTATKNDHRGIPTPPPEDSETEDVKSTQKYGTRSPKPQEQAVSSRSSLRPLHPNIALSPCSSALLPGLKRLNILLLPIPYPANFYNEILSDPTTSSITLLAIWHEKTPQDILQSTNSQVTGKVVGAIRCRLLPSPTAPREERMLYISTLGVLSPYQGHGIATQLLERVCERAGREFGVKVVGAHVWEASVDAREWYKKRGFVEERTEGDYYRRLEPTGAVIVSRRIGG